MLPCLNHSGTAEAKAVLSAGLNVGPALASRILDSELLLLRENHHQHALPLCTLARGRADLLLPGLVLLMLQQPVCMCHEHITALGVTAGESKVTLKWDCSLFPADDWNVKFSFSLFLYSSS